MLTAVDHVAHIATGRRAAAACALLCLSVRVEVFGCLIVCARNNVVAVSHGAKAGNSIGPLWRPSRTSGGSAPFSHVPNPRLEALSDSPENEDPSCATMIPPLRDDDD